MDRAARIARRLGGPAARRRRHRRAALLGILLLGVAAVLIAVGGDDTDERDEVLAVCRASNEEIGAAQRALLGGNDAEGAVEGFLADAFVDLARERAGDIRAVEPGDDVLAIVEAHDAVVDAIEADPAAAAGLENPFDEVNARWRDAGLDECQIGPDTVPR